MYCFTICKDDCGSDEDDYDAFDGAVLCAGKLAITFFSTRITISTMLMQFSSYFMLSARGGAPSHVEYLWQAGGGGGGRIAIHYDDNSMGDLDADFKYPIFSVQGGAVSP